ncbi:hypothetical protein [Stygiolobus caldivivus]|uniref:hypothetical protein n=1 Tax=Stygiolobus caldivivus TaxID=2824673 RepID=UPI001C853F69|nr:hypothetical protein [Stygiolobus caldivivus]
MSCDLTSPAIRALGPNSLILSQVLKGKALISLLTNVSHLHEDALLLFIVLFAILAKRLKG